MLILNFLVLVATTALAGVIPSVLSHFSPSIPSVSPQETCAFTSNPTRPPSISQIPCSAWPLIAHILTSHPTIRHHLASASPSPKENILQTLDLGQLSNDASLEGVNLGIVFSTRQDFVSTEGQQRLGDRHREEMIRRVETGRRDLECLDKAIVKIGERQQTEGSLEFEAGRLSFLVYRLD